MPQHIAPDSLRQMSRATGVQQRVSVLTTIVFPDADGVWTCQVTADDNASWAEEQAQEIAQVRMDTEIAKHHGIDVGPGAEHIRISLTSEERVNSTNPDAPGCTIFTYKEAA